MAAELKTRVIVLGYSRYNFVDTDTGRNVEGCKVHYVEQEGKSEENTEGHIPAVANLPYASFDTLEAVPGLYDADISLKMTGRKPGLQVTGFTYVSPITFGE